MAIALRDIQLKDLEDYFRFNHPSREFHKWNGPYFEKETLEQLRIRVDKIKYGIFSNRKDYFVGKKLIVDAISDAIIGEVNWYWKSKETAWMEVGIVIFNEKYWNTGIGSLALPLWIDEIFLTYQNLVRIGLSTWS